MKADQQTFNLRSHALLVLWLPIALSCDFNATFKDCTVACTPSSGCPDGLSCRAEGLCRSPEVMTTCAARPLSCDGLAATCGPTASDECCLIASVPGGQFLRYFDLASDGMYTDTTHHATISAFVLDRFEVTVGRFRSFVEAGGGTQQHPPPAGASARTLNGAPNQGGWDPAWNTILVADTATLIAMVKCDASHQSWTDVPGGNEDLPMNCVTWYEAFTFCAWDGGFLPTDTEWNFAASGGDEQRAYPWSSPPGALVIDCSYANYYDDPSGGAHCDNTTIGAANRVGSESPKGYGRWGHSDLGGNVGEWVLDEYPPVSATECDDCANLSATGDRIVRASDWANAAPTLRTSFWKHTIPTGNRDPKIGIRCARPTI